MQEDKRHQRPLQGRGQLEKSLSQKMQLELKPYPLRELSMSEEVLVYQ
jgi:hypothetical protein